MPPELIDLVKAFLDHPAMLWGGALAVTLGASVLVRAQLIHVGLNQLKLPGAERIDLADLGAALAFWLTGLACAGLLVEPDPRLTVILPLFGLALRAAEAGLVLCAIAWALSALTASSQDAGQEARQQSETLRQVGVVLGAAVVVAVLSGSDWLPLFLLGALVATAIWLARDQPARTGLFGWFQDVVAGLRLRESWGEGGEVEAEGRSLLLTGPIGWERTPVREGGEDRSLSNRELARLIATLDRPRPI